MDAGLDLGAAAVAAACCEREREIASARPQLADVALADAYANDPRRDVEISDDLLLADAPSRRVRRILARLRSIARLSVELQLHEGIVV